MNSLCHFLYQFALLKISYFWVFQVWIFNCKVLHNVCKIYFTHLHFFCDLSVKICCSLMSWGVNFSFIVFSILRIFLKIYILSILFICLVYWLYSFAFGHLSFIVLFDMLHTDWRLRSFHNFFLFAMLILKKFFTISRLVNVQLHLI